MLLTLLVLVVLVIGLLAALVQAQLEKYRLKQSLRKYDTLIDKEEFERQLDSNIQLKQDELVTLGSQQELLNYQIKLFRDKLRELQAKEYLQSIDSYEPKYDFISSKDYILRLEDIKLQQQEMCNNGQAFVCNTPWKVGESERKGKKMITDLLKLVELSFETQCNYTIKEVKFNNVKLLNKKINNTFKKMNKLLKEIDCQISEEYLRLKLIELDIKYELEAKQKEERDREQEFNRQKKEREAIEKARQKAKEAEEREKLHQQELDKVRQEIGQIAQAEVEKRNQLELKIQQLERQIAEDRSDKEKAKRGKIGYIYIISNIGSLGRDVYRICMTNRLREDEYIRDMNPIVPFKFDVHFKIFSEDVFDTLEKLHQRFDEKRVNVVNSRREFFKVSMDEIEQAVQEIARATGVLRIDEFERLPQAYEYHQTIAARKKTQQLTPEDSSLWEDEIA